MVLRCAEARKSQKVSKYRSLIQDLPNVFKPDYGYHSECYRKFTSVKTKDMFAGEPRTSEIKKKRTNVTAGEENASILPAVCIFCSAKRKKNKQVDVKHMKQK